jgi:hypothetical protein
VHGVTLTLDRAHAVAECIRQRAHPDAGAIAEIRLQATGPIQIPIAGFWRRRISSPSTRSAWPRSWTCPPSNGSRPIIASRWPGSGGPARQHQAEARAADLERERAGLASACQRLSDDLSDQQRKTVTQHNRAEAWKVARPHRRLPRMDGRAELQPAHHLRPPRLSEIRRWITATLFRQSTPEDRRRMRPC